MFEITFGYICTKEPTYTLAGDVGDTWQRQNEFSLDPNLTNYHVKVQIKKVLNAPQCYGVVLGATNGNGEIKVKHTSRCN